MNPFKFSLSLGRMHAGADRAQLRLRAEDHGRSYRGRKVPLSVTISCTHRCNLACLHCQSENSARKPDIPEERLLSLVDEIALSGVTRVGFTGGEPLMREDMGRILRRCRERGLVLSLVSNGWLVPSRLDDLKDLNLLFLSFDGDKEAHDRVRGPGSFERLCRAARAAHAAGLPVAFLSTLGSYNMGCVREMSRIVQELRVHWMVTIIQSGFTGRAEQDVTPEQVRRAVEAARSCPRLRTSKRYLDFLLAGKPPARCYAGVGYCIIAPDGRMFPCFPAEFDHAGYAGVAAQGRAPARADACEGMSILDRPFEEAFQALPLYRKTCSSCSLACHIENNFLYEFDPGSILNSARLLHP